MLNHFNPTPLSDNWLYEYKFSGTVEDITSRQYIKHFPFVPKTFNVDVRVEKNQPFTEERFIHDPEQLREVFEYYDIMK